MTAQSQCGTSKNKPQERGGWYSHMAMHVASRRGGWTFMFLRNANAACLNANCTAFPVLRRQTDAPTRFSMSELSYVGPVGGLFGCWGSIRFFFVARMK